MTEGNGSHNTHREPVRERVLEFYRALPFNLFSDPNHAGSYLTNNPLPQKYPDLHQLLSRGASTFLDAGCGAGWLSVAVAKHYGAAVTGIDFNPVAIQAATELASALGSSVRFEECDLHEVADSGVTYDIVCALGVLHHTSDPKRALARLLEVLAPTPRARLFVGLYHRYGREPFLRRFQELLAGGATEAELYEVFRRMNPSRTDDMHLRSWFRDQVLHPHETQHTLQEVCAWCEELGLELESTSINRFAPFQTVEELFAFEPEFAELSRRRNYDEGIFFPGFFTVCLKRHRTAQTPP